MKFLEALHHMVAGHKVRRNVWSPRWRIELVTEDDGTQHFHDEEKAIMKLSAEDVQAEDWSLYGDA